MIVARVAGVLIALVCLVALGAGSQIPWRMEDGGAGLVRFSWRAAGQRVEQCREPTPADLEGLPDHMRPQEICERRMRPYRLRIRIDGQAVTDRTLRASGAQEDRPVYVFVEHTVAPGLHRVEIDFRSIDESPAAAADTTVPTSGPGAPADGGAVVTMDAGIDVASGDIVVIGLRDDGSGFEILTGEPNNR